MRNYSNLVLMEDGQLLSDMRDKGMSNEDAKFLLETYNLEPYTQEDWDEVLYHADMQDIHKACKWDDYDYAVND